MVFPLLYENVTRINSLNHTKRDIFPDSTPIGVVVHYSADRDTDRMIRSLHSQGLGYHIVIDRDGHVLQLNDFHTRVWHAGKAHWKGYSPNQRFISVAVSSWGYVKQDGSEGFFEAWNGSKIPESCVRQRVSQFDKSIQYWDMATQEQTKQLMIFLRWCAQFGIDPNLICGHDECAMPPGRKQDPGGVLEHTMQEIRNGLVSFNAARSEGNT